MKLIFLDADGTLFHHEGYIPESAIQACKQAQQRGHKIILCTGRQRIEIFGDMLKIKYDAIIAGSGAMIECEGKIIEENAFSKEESQYLANYLEKNHIPADYETSKGIYATKDTIDLMESMVEEQTKNKTKEEKEKYALNVLYHQTNLVKEPSSLLFNKISVIDNHKTPFKKIYNDLHTKFDVIPATFAPLGKESCEIGSYLITKATGMESVIQYFHADIQDTIAIGDGHNDLKMFEKANYSIAMGNACNEVKEKADVVTSSLEQNGIYHIFKKLNLIES